MLTGSGERLYRRSAERQAIFLNCVLRRSNTRFRHLNLLEAFEGKQEFNRVDGRIFACLSDYGAERVGDGGVERDALDHQSGQVEAYTLVGGECHLFSEFGPSSGKTQVAT